MIKVAPKVIFDAMNDFFESWKTVNGDISVLPRKPTRGYVGINSAGEAHHDGMFDANELAWHIADALNGTPRKRFSELSKLVIAAQESEDSLTEYEKKFERAGVWLMGPHILTQIVDFLKGKSLVAEVNEIDPTRIDIRAPLPLVRDEITGREVSIQWMVPGELQVQFAYLMTCAMQRHLGNSDFLKDYLSSIVTSVTLQRINNEFLSREYEKRARGDNELWHEVGFYLGVVDLNSRGAITQPMRSKPLGAPSFPPETRDQNGNAAP